jgi:hypothetical protein
VRPARLARDPRRSSDHAAAGLTKKKPQRTPRSWFDQLTTSAHPEPVEGCVLCDLRGFFRT